MYTCILLPSTYTLLALTYLCTLTDLLTVSETAIHPPDDEGASNSINSPKNLSMEATYINHNFAQQVGRSTASASNLMTLSCNLVGELYAKSFFGLLVHIIYNTFVKY